MFEEILRMGRIVMTWYVHQMLREKERKAFINANLRCQQSLTIVLPRNGFQNLTNSIIAFIVSFPSDDLHFATIVVQSGIL